uniref:Uncharacterized protein n=1 Tax=Rhizophora mucronata TaxID=61149 RepID=A0A2P2ITJ8_RHIMU
MSLFTGCSDCLAIDDS